jgi:hypothetical protein
MLLTLVFLALQALLALLPFFRGGNLGSDHLLLSFNAYVPIRQTF